jgi:hypothetical protein
MRRSIVARECPKGKRGTLLLTTKSDIQASIRKTPDRYIAIIPIREYLHEAGADAASTYYARISGSPLTLLTSLTDATFTQAELGEFLQEHLDLESLNRWADSSPGNREILKTVATRSPIKGEEVLALLEGLSLLGDAEVEAIARRVQDTSGNTGAQRILEVVTASPPGRRIAAEVFASRLEERIADAKEEVASYSQLIAEPGVTENRIQRFLEKRPWVIGLAYLRARPRVQIPRGEVDFVLDRYDGLFDIVELKSPEDPIISESRQAKKRPASASSYALGPALSKALAQAHHYRAILDKGRDLADQYGLNDPRQPRVIILVGKSSSLSEAAGEILRQLNLSLHRVEILPYDVLGRRTAGWLNNVEQLLPVARSNS